MPRILSIFKAVPETLMIPKRLDFNTLFISFFFIAFFLSACTNGSKEGHDKNIFRYNLTTPVSSLDPAFARNQSNIWATGHIYKGLIETDSSLNYRPALAKSWEISADGLIYTFTLRSDVFFQDNECFPDGEGRRFVASDVVYSFNRLIDPSLNSPGSWIFTDRLAGKPWEAPNDSTVILYLSKPFQPMLGILSMPYCFIVPNEAVDHYGSGFRNNPVGTGAFEMVRWIENEVLILRKNQKYFEFDESGNRLPYIDGIRAQFISDKYTAFLELKQGNLDFISGIDASYTHEALFEDGTLRPSVKKMLYIQKTPFLNTEYIGIGIEHLQKTNPSHPLMDKRVRQALNYGIDREQMLRTFRMNIGVPGTTGFIPRGLPEFQPEKFTPLSFNPVKAAELLAEAGYPNGIGMPELTVHTNADYLDLITYITRKWEDLGIKSSIELMESATLREQMSRRNISMFRGSWIADYPDAETFLTVFYGQNPAPPNYTGFSDAAYDNLYINSLTETNKEERMKMHLTMNEILIGESPVIFLFYDETARFINRRVSGLPAHAFNYLDLLRVELN